MTSENQIAANRDNAKRSTGPRSPEGKRAVRQNAIRHGMLARDAVLPGESLEGYEALKAAILADLKPAGALEAEIASRIVNILWRLRRLGRAECTLLHWLAVSLKAKRFSLKAESFLKTVLVGDWPVLEETIVTDKKRHEAALKELEPVVAERDSDDLLMGQTFNADAREADAIGKLSRYESHLERLLHRNISALRDLQERRQSAD